MFIIVLVWILCAFLGMAMGKERNIGAAGGFVLGLLLGFIGLIIVAFSPKITSSFEDLQQDYLIADSYKKIQEEQIAKSTAADELKKWHDLKQSGAISEEEFEEKKKKILN